MRIIITSLTLLLFVFSLQAQDNKSNREAFLKQKQQEKQQYMDSMRQNFDEYRRRANEEYAQFMRQRWEEFQAMKGNPVPEIPEPPQPYRREKDLPVPELPIKYNKVTIPTPTPKPLEPLKRPESPVIPNTPKITEFSFLCYGTSLKVHLDNSLRFKLDNISENAVADAWDQLASETAEVLLEDCLSLREQLSLGDWAYYCMLRDLSETYLGKNTNEAIVMETFMLAQSGYKVRIARKDNRLVLLVPFEDKVYVMSYVPIDGSYFYIIDQGQGGSLQIFNRSLTDNERVMSLRMKEPPKFSMKASNNRTLTSKRYPELSVTLSTNQHLMDFYEGYPQCVWSNYSWAGLSDEVKAKLYPVLRKGIEGKSQIDAANRIINFVQTAFDYKTDQEQFGYERPLFADESFYYPYCDCEDRSILFSILIKDLLGLEVVLLHYPEHLATAVHFTESLSGTYFTMDGKTWFVSDPTYIGANVGECMPRYAKTNPEVYKL
jgi:hypothetical protein